MKKVNYIIILFLLFYAKNYSQSVKDSLNFTRNQYLLDRFDTSLEKRLNTYNLNSRLNYSYENSNIFVGINENYFSSLVKTSTKNIKDEQNLSMLFEYKIHPKIRAGILTQNNIYSDDRKIAINQASNLFSTVFLNYYPISNLSIVPFGGYSINNQIGEKDKGTIYGANINLNNFYAGDILFDSKIKFQNEDIAPRKNIYNIANVRLRNFINDKITNVFTANYSNTRKDFYFEADSLTKSSFNISNNIQSRLEKKYSFEENLFNSKFLSDFHFNITGKFYLRQIEKNIKYPSSELTSATNYNTMIEESRIEFNGITEYRSKDFFTRFGLNYSEREESHSLKKSSTLNLILFEKGDELERRKNNTSNFTTLHSSSNFRISSKDNITLSLFHRKLVYDTPSDENFDDRDEILSIGRLSYNRKLSLLFDMFANIEFSYNHIVYTFSERSSNNNVRRIVKLNTGGVFQNKEFFSRNTFEVSANYTTYDFEDINPNSRSFSFRQLRFEDSTSINFFRKVFLEIDGYAKISEQGDFHWDKFSSNPNRFLAEYYSQQILRVKKDEISFGLGFRIFALKTFGYNENNVKYLLKDYSSIGPMADFNFRTNNLSIFFHGWYEFINNEDSVKQELANLSLGVYWNL